MSPSRVAADDGINGNGRRGTLREECESIWRWEDRKCRDVGGGRRYSIALVGSLLVGDVDAGSIHPIVRTVVEESQEDSMLWIFYEEKESSRESFASSDGDDDGKDVECQESS